MKSPEHLIVVGPSAAGKTTLVDGLRVPSVENRVVIPKRYITRDERVGDNRVENQHVTEEEFEEKVANGQIFPYWERVLGIGKIAKYGFKKLDSDDKLKVYSGNNALLRDVHPQLNDFLRSGFVVFVTASYETRRERIRERSPDLMFDEVNVRLADDGADVAHRAHAIIDTTDVPASRGQAALMAIVNSLTK